MQCVTAHIRTRGDTSAPVHARTFWCPDAGGYVRERGHGDLADDRQVCRGLDGWGSTLDLGARDDLGDLIRREAKRGGYTVVKLTYHDC